MCCVEFHNDLNLFDSLFFNVIVSVIFVNFYYFVVWSLLISLDQERKFHIEKLHAETDILAVNYLHINNYFATILAVCPIAISFTQIIKIRQNKYVHALTKLRNEIYVLCRSFSSAPSVIRVLQDRYPFRLQREIKVEEIRYPTDIGSSEKKNCLYVSDRGEKGVWKITREPDD